MNKVKEFLAKLKQKVLEIFYEAFPVYRPRPKIIYPAAIKLSVVYPKKIQELAFPEKDITPLTGYVHYSDADYYIDANACVDADINKYCPLDPAPLLLTSKAEHDLTTTKEMKKVIDEVEKEFNDYKDKYLNKKVKKKPKKKKPKKSSRKKK